MARWTKLLTRAEWLRLSGFGAAVLFLHLLGWGLFLYYARNNAALAGLGSLAYTFGLRHAFDADHIAAIDNTTRKFLQDGKRSVGVGFFFSLGHSTIVFSLAAGLAIAAKTVNSRIPTFQDYGGYIGASVSGTFLLLIGLLNLAVLLDILGVFRQMKRGAYNEQKLEQALQNQGLMSRFFLKRVGDRIDASWKMYPLGVLFGLGFDTATEIGLLALAAGVATHNVQFLAVISLPIMFAAGMSLMDTADGAFMSHAYGWAFSNPIRKVYYNITVTSLSVAVALIIGTIELL
jgi:nickel/cobalt transporter (NiCoT) family protein